MVNAITTIKITSQTHESLNKIGKRGETYDEIVSFLIDLYFFASKKSDITRSEWEKAIKEQ